jgi:hypothetical protein
MVMRASFGFGGLRNNKDEGRKNEGQEPAAKVSDFKA